MNGLKTFFPLENIYYHFTEGDFPGTQSGKSVEEVLQNVNSHLDPQNMKIHVVFS